MAAWIVAGAVMVAVVFGAAAVVLRAVVLVHESDLADWDEAEPTDWDPADAEAFTSWPRGTRA